MNIQIGISVFPLPRFLAAVLVVFCASNMEAQIAGVQYRRLLLPVVVDAPVPGANGSQWETVLSLTNLAASQVWVYPVVSGGNCSATGCDSPNTSIPARLTIPAITYTSLLATGTPPSNGVILHVDDRFADLMRVSLRVHDVSRQAKSWGTTLPVVPENRFADSVSLLALPGQDPNFRVNVRIYSLKTDAPVQVMVRVFATTQKVRFDTSAEDVFAGSLNVLLTPPGTDDSLPGHPPDVVPAHAFIGDLTAITGGTLPSLFRLEVTSATPGATIWALASITNNDTQEVTVVAPAEH
jgi:hypothetical protein